MVWPVGYLPLCGYYNLRTINPTGENNMGGINPILQALLNALHADPYSHEDYVLSAQRNGTYTYQQKPVEFKLTESRIGNTTWIRGMIGDDVVDVKVVEAGRCNLDIILPKVNEREQEDRIGLTFEFNSEEQLRSHWKRLELLFSYVS